LKMINMKDNQQQKTKHNKTLDENQFSIIDHTGKKYSILHIDDDESLLLLSKTFIEEIAPHIRVKQEPDSSKVTDHINSEFDCILVDFSMPVYNGLDVCKKIREIKNTPIILFTGKDEEMLPIQEFNELGVKYIQKSMDPLNYFKLVNTIIDLINQELAERKELLIKAVD